MTTRLGLYAAPVTAPSSPITSISTTIDINIEVADQTAVSATFTTNLEVAEQTAVSGTVSVNIEVADTSVPGGSGSEGGTPDAILNLPTYAKASRLRADFYSWTVIILPPVRTVELPGVKVGSAPLASITEFGYTTELDAAGEWSILIPANDERASVITDGTAKVIRLYYEDVGHILTGIIEDYEIVDEETMRVSGRDLLSHLANINTLWRLDTKTIGIITNIGSQKTFQQPSSKHWISYYKYVMDEFFPGVFYQFENNFINSQVYSGYYDSDGVWQWEGIVPKYQSQTALDIFRDFNNTSGNHFRIHPSSQYGVIDFGAFGDDSGIIIAPVQEDDPTAREQGALVLKSFDYVKTKDELVNMIAVQGSNDSFGIAVELIHSSKPQTYKSQYRHYDITFDFDTGAAIYTRGTYTDGETFLPDYDIDEVPSELLTKLFNIYTQNRVELLSPVTTVVSPIFANIGSDQYRRAVAMPFSVGANFYPTIATVLNCGGIGTFQMAIVPKSGDVPDTSNLAARQFRYTNYFANRLPGNIVAKQGERIYVDEEGNPVKSNSTAVIFYLPGGNPSEANRDYGIITQMFGFMDMGQFGYDGQPWPLLTPGDYYLVIWYSGGPVSFNISGFDLASGGPASVHAGHFQDRIMLLKTRTYDGGDPTLYLGDDGNWRYESGFKVPFTIYGRNANSQYPYAIEGMLAETIKDNGSGHRVFYMRDVDSIETYGLRQASVSFPNAIDTSEGIPDIVPASDMLHDQSQVYLANRKDPFEKLTVTCTGLFRLPYVGQKVRFVYRGMALNENGDYKWLDINSDWYVLSIQWQITNEGLEHTLTLSNISQDIVNPRNLAADVLSNLNRSKNNLGELIVGSRRLGDGINVT